MNNYIGKKAVLINGSYFPALEKLSVVEIIESDGITVNVRFGDKTHEVYVFDLAIEGVTTPTGLILRKSKGAFRSGVGMNDTTYIDYMSKRKLKLPKKYYGTMFGKQQFYNGGFFQLKRQSKGQFEGIDLITKQKVNVPYHDVRGYMPVDYKIPELYPGEKYKIAGDEVVINNISSLYQRFSVNNIVNAKRIKSGTKKVATLVDNIFDPYTKDYVRVKLTAEQLNLFIHPNYLDDFINHALPTKIDVKLIIGKHLSNHSVLRKFDDYSVEPQPNVNYVGIKELFERFYPRLKNEVEFLPDDHAYNRAQLTDTFAFLRNAVTPQGYEWWRAQDLRFQDERAEIPKKENNPIVYDRTFDNITVRHADNYNAIGLISTFEKTRLQPPDVMKPVDGKFLTVISKSFKEMLDAVAYELDTNGAYVGATLAKYGNLQNTMNHLHSFMKDNTTYYHLLETVESQPVGNWFHYKKVEKTVSFTPKSKTPEFTADGKILTTNRQQFKLGKFVKLLFPAFADVQIQGFVHACEAYINDTIVVSANVMQVYEDSGDSNIGACMSGDDSDKMQFAEDCGAEIIYIKQKGRLQARALVWHNVEVMDDGPYKGKKITLVDRIYYSSESYSNMIKKYAKEKGWWHKTIQDFHSEKAVVFMEDGNVVERQHTLRVQCPEESSNGQYPYLDTFSTSTSEYLVNDGSGYFGYRSTGGDRDGDDESTVYSEFHGESIREDDSVWSERYNSYLYDHVASYDDVNSEYIHQSDAVELHDGRTTHDEDAVHCETDNQYYLSEDDEIFLYQEDYYRVDDENFYFYEGEHYHVDDDEITTNEDGDICHVDEL